MLPLPPRMKPYPGWLALLSLLPIFLGSCSIMISASISFPVCSAASTTCFPFAQCVGAPTFRHGRWGVRYLLLLGLLDGVLSSGRRPCCLLGRAGEGEGWVSSCLHLGMTCKHILPVAALRSTTEHLYSVVRRLPAHRAHHGCRRFPICAWHLL